MKGNTTIPVIYMKEFDRLLVARRICSIRRFFVRLSGITARVCSNQCINAFNARATCTVEKTESPVGFRIGQQLPILRALAHIPPWDYSQWRGLKASGGC
jgi:hypothetical protein